jgi:hypothetical protein
MRSLALALVLLASAAPAAAGIPVTQRMTCPIGGERFDFATTASYSTFGSRPDGLPYGSWTFPLALPECPGNGLILYKEFGPQELRRLEVLIGEDAYQALRSGGDVQYYRLAWLLRGMEAPRDDQLWALVQAGWQAEVGSPLRARYLSEPADLSAFAFRARRINALRELGRMDEAAALLARTPLDRLRALSDDIRGRDGWLGYYERIAAIVERRDASAEPLDFIPKVQAAMRCVDQAAALDDWQRSYCAREDMREAVERARDYAAQRRR